MAPPVAFEQAFGIEVAKLRRVLRKYSTKLPFFCGKMPNPYPADRITVRAAPADQVAAELGRLLAEPEGRAVAGATAPADAADQAGGGDTAAQ
jgi:hypothetical protein